MKKQSISRLVWTCILVAWVFDLLFWKRTPGISYFLMVVLLAAAGLLLAKGEGIHPARRAWILLLPVLFFAGMTFFRAEPFTVAYNVVGSVLLLCLTAVTFTGGRWMEYSLADYIQKFFHLGLSALSRLALFAAEKPGAPAIPVTEKKPSSRRSILRGILLALPIVLGLGALLASADPIFNTTLSQMFSFFQIEHLGEYLFRLFYILVLAYLLAGVYLHAFTQSAEPSLEGEDHPLVSPFLGWIESVIILGAIDLLFGLFVFIQFKYFFGGQGNIHIDGYTYAEYARKGFTELVVVAVISLLILQVLNTITRRTEKKERALFSGFSIGLVAMVLVILASAYQRLQLYELAYGFSRIRVYVHVFMIWLGILLLVTVIIELKQRPRAFALSVVLVCIGFGVTINLVNVDGLIARENVARREAGQELDIAYLVSLSDDAVPYLAREYSDAQASPQLKQEAGAVLACRLDAQRIRDEKNQSTEKTAFWGSYQSSRATAATLLGSLAQDLDARYQVTWDETDLATYATIGDTRYDCGFYSGRD